MSKLNPQAAEPFFIQVIPLPPLAFFHLVPLYYNTQSHLLYTPLYYLPTTPLQTNTQYNSPDDAKSYYKRNDQASGQRKKKMTCRSVWRRSKGVSIEGEVKPLPADDPYDFNKFKGIFTTVMVKNIPGRISKKVFLELLDKHCVEVNTKLDKQADDQSEYDFVYLRIDFKSELNNGYGFVNFTNPNAAERFYNSFHKLKWANIGFLSHADKICEIKRAKYQGKERLVKCFKRSLFKCRTNEYLPTVFSPPRNGHNSAQSVASVVGKRSV